MKIIANTEDLVEPFHARIEITLRNIVNTAQKLNDSITAMSHQSWVRCPKTTPIVFTYCVRWRNGTKPLMKNSPLVGTRMPVSILIVVDFPAPFGPM